MKKSSQDSHDHPAPKMSKITADMFEKEPQHNLKEIKIKGISQILKNM